MEKGYSVEFGSIEDAIPVYEVLEEVLVDRSKPIQGQERDIRRLRNNILLCIQEELLVVLRYSGKVVGAQLLQNRKGVLPLVIHSNIVEAHRNSLGTVLLLGKVVNEIFAGQDVFVLSPPKAIQSMLDYVDGDVWKIKDTISSCATKYLRRHYG